MKREGSSGRVSRPPVMQSLTYRQWSAITPGANRTRRQLTSTRCPTQILASVVPPTRLPPDMLTLPYARPGCSIELPVYSGLLKSLVNESFVGENVANGGWIR
jgi:hypothetical protein